MACYIISYDLDKPGQNYDDLYKVIKSYGTWCHPLDSTWFVVTDESTTRVRDRLLEVLDVNDKLFVGKLSGQASWYGFSAKASEWLKEELSRI